MPHSFKLVFAIQKRVDAVRADGTPVLKTFGFGSMAVEGGEILIDHHQDIIEPNELEVGAYDFVKYARQLDVQHDRNPIGVLIESFYLSPEKCKAMDISDARERCGWWTGFEIADPTVIEGVKAGKWPMMSVDITAERHVLAADQTAERITKAKKNADGSTPAIGRLRKLRIKLLSLVDAGANQGADVCLWKRAEPLPTPEKEPVIMQIKTLTKAEADAMLSAIMAKITPEEQAALTAMLAAIKPADTAPPAPSAEGEETPAAKAYKKALAAQDVEITKLREEQAKIREERNLEVEISKVRKDGLERVGTATVEDIAKMRISMRKELPAMAPKFEAILKSYAEVVKQSGLLKQFGLPPAGDEEPTTFNALYAAEKAKRPTEDPTKIASELAQKHPDLYRARNGA